MKKDTNSINWLLRRFVHNNPNSSMITTIMTDKCATIRKVVKDLLIIIYVCFTFCTFLKDKSVVKILIFHPRK